MKFSERGNRRVRRQVLRAAEAVVEQLEPRRLLSATLSAGQLNILGTAGDDNIVVQMDPVLAKTLDVDVNGVTMTFSTTGIRQITITGYDGNDSIVLSGLVPIKARITDGNGNDTLIGSSFGHDTLIAGNGADLLQSNGAQDVLEAGSGMDTLTGGTHDTLIAGGGDDTLTANGAYDHLAAGNGQDSLTGSSSGHDVLVAGAGTDLLQATGGAGNWLQAGRGNDTLTGGTADSYHYGAGINLISKNYGASEMEESTTPHPLPSAPGEAGAKATEEIAFPGGNGPEGGDSITSEFNTVGYNNIDTIEAAYSIPNPLLSGDPDGAGETIAIIDAYGPTPASVTSDLTQFSLDPPEDDDISSDAASPDEILNQSGVPLLGISGADTVNGIITPGALSVPGTISGEDFGAGTFTQTALPTPTTSTAPSADQFTFDVVLATPNGQIPTVTPAQAGLYGVETDLDVEWAHAIAPKATIMLFQAAPVAETALNPEGLSLANLMFATNEAALYLSTHGGGVVSMSFGGGEFPGEYQYDDAIFGNPLYKNVSFVASAGDTGGEDSWPAVSPYVTSVGGTTLLKQYDQGMDGNGIFPWLEYAWNYSGAGPAAGETVPDYQVNTVIGDPPNTILVPPGAGAAPTLGDPGTGMLGVRAGPDVAMLADPATGVAIYDTTPSPEDGLSQGWAKIGGTSLSAPMFAGIVALANQSRGELGVTSDAAGDHTLGVDLNAALYNIFNTEYAPTPDVATTGTDKTVTPNVPILGNFQLRGETGDIPDITPLIPTDPNAPIPEFPELTDSTVGMFYDIGGAFTDKGAADHSQGVVGATGGERMENTNLGWDYATGLGAPNVNNLVETTIPATAGLYTITSAVSGGGVIDFNDGPAPTVNLANIAVDLDNEPPLYHPVFPFEAANGLNVKASAVQYVPFNSPSAGSSFNTVNYRGTGTVTPSGLGLAAFNLSLTLTTAQANPASSTVTGTLNFAEQDIPYDPQTGDFGAEFTDLGELFWIQGSISASGQSISGTVYSISGLDGNGNPIPVGKDGTNSSGVGGEIVVLFSS